MEKPGFTWKNSELLGDVLEKYGITWNDLAEVSSNANSMRNVTLCMNSRNRNQNTRKYLEGPGDDGDNEKILSLLHDLENEGQTRFCLDLSYLRL